MVHDMYQILSILMNVLIILKKKTDKSISEYWPTVSKIYLIIVDLREENVYERERLNGFYQSWESAAEIGPMPKI